jgi:thiol-disulfide isomerase/thioredoxin
VASFALATLSGAVSWMVQFMVTGLTYFTAGLILGRRPDSRWHMLRSALLVLLPYVLLYGGLSIAVRSVQTYPIWILGILGWGLGTVTGARLRCRRSIGIAFAAYFVAVVPGGSVLMSHWLSYVFRPVNSRLNQRIDYRLSTDHGTWVTSEDLKGKVVVIKLWATSCAACIEEFPLFDSFFRKHQDDPDVAIYSVNIPLEGDSPDQIEQMTRGRGYAFPVLFTSHDVQSVKSQFGIQGIPTVLVMDPAGVVRYSGPLVVGGHDFIDRIDLDIQRAKQAR